MIKKYSTDFYESVDARANSTAEVVLAEIFANIASGAARDIVDIGCGSGAWMNAALKNPVTCVTGLDLPESIEINELRFKHLLNNRLNLVTVDFEKIISMPTQIFDLGICLEVFEHISDRASHNLIKWMKSHTKYLLFSAATPGQGGTGHINERPHKYWLRNFENQGFIAYDPIRLEIQNNPNCARFYALNIFLLENTNLIQTTKLSSKFAAGRTTSQKVKDYRKNSEKIRFAIVRLLPQTLVSIIAKVFKY